MKKVNFEEYKDIVLGIYEHTEKVFRKNSIKPIANSGTLLGIVRHNNDFIPWDDDIDVIVSYKDFNEKYSEIQKEINSENGDYYIINFQKNDEKIYSNILLARVYKREKIAVEYEGETSERWPFIDVFFAAPADTFKTEFKWKRYDMQHQYYWMTRKGFNRWPKKQNKPVFTFFMNLITYPTKLFIWRWKTDNFISKPYNNTNGNWKYIRRVDPWTRRKVFYDMENLIETNLKGVPIYMSATPEDELKETFGKNWKEPIFRAPHISNPATIYHRRNIEVDKFMTKKFGVENE